MRIFLKVVILTILLALLFLLGFILFGESLTTFFTQQKVSAWFVSIKSYAWLIGIGLLVSDLVLPIPATPIMAALGTVYGPWLGTLFGFAGSCLAGFSGYFIARCLGKGALKLIASETEIVQFQGFFNTWGGAAIIISRMTPILPEVMTILAGLSKMKIERFTLALSLGTLPTAFLYAYIGHAAKTEPVYAVIGATLLPLAIWPIYLKMTSKGK
ncbi:MAG: VTT domain-containing protein [Desulfobacterales bacterium]|jgi:uncharacterized membrane protein YdjX (TVP38/TMEM64 family)|nr:VTT domain-containing protein [Desulfobacterales bacterium]